MRHCTIYLNLIACVQVLLTVWVVFWFAKQPRCWLNALLASVALAAVVTICAMISPGLFARCDACGETSRATFQTALTVTTLFFIPATFFFWIFNDKGCLSIKKTEKYWLFFGLFLSLITCFFILYGVPEFAILFESFGANLPLQTLTLLAYYQWVVLLPILVLATWFTRHEHRGSVAALIGIVGSVVVMTYALWSAYSPVFVVGCAI